MTARAPTFVLGIDQAAVSGWAIARVGGRVLESGVARERSLREGVIMRAIELAGDVEELLLVFEDHSDIPLGHRARYNPKTRMGPQRNAASLIGMGRALGRWEGLLDHYAHPERLRIGVTSADWRIRVLGCTNKPGTEELKARAQRWARGQMPGAAMADHNEAEAVCIAAWGALDGASVLAKGREVRRMGARRRKAQKRQQELFGGLGERG